VHRAELVVCPAPATAQADIARVIAPHLASNQVVFVPPGTFGSMLFAVAQRRPAIAPTRSFAETARALAHPQARALRGGDHRPCEAAADRRLSRAP
jgi:hypothetical protein